MIKHHLMTGVRAFVIILFTGAATAFTPTLALGCSSSDDKCGGSCSDDTDCEEGAKCLSFGGSDATSCMPAACNLCSQGCKYNAASCEYDSCASD
jgi:hypothetical protein